MARRRRRAAQTQGNLIFNSAPIVVPPPKNYGIEAPPAPKPSPQPIPDPIKPLPPEELQGDPYTAPGEAILDQSPERYKKVGADWQIQAEPQIAPLVMVTGKRPDLKPLLLASGIVVKVGDEYLCSKRTLADILNSGNPHYDVAENGRVLNVPMGKSVPIIELDISKLPDMVKNRDEINRYAGVFSVDYVTETELVPGTNIPMGLLYQINYTMVNGVERNPDNYEIWDLLASLQGNYAISSLVTSTAQEENKLDKNKLGAFLEGLDERLRLIRRDFNNIKRIYYNGDPPEGTVPTIKFSKVAKGVDEDEERSKNRVVIKTTELVATQATPNTTGGEDPVAKLKEELKSGEFKLPGAGGGSLKDFRTRPGQPDQRQALIAKWQSYKWSEKEAEYLKKAAIKEYEKPPTVVSATIRDPKDSGANGKKIIKYYGWKNPDTEEIIGFRFVEWTMEIMAKGRIMDPMPKGWSRSSNPSPIISPKDEELLIEYYGKPPGYDKQKRSPSGRTVSSASDNKNEFWWINQNNKRQAEIIQLAYQIHKIELETGKKIPAVQPPGVSLGGKAITSLNVGNRPGGVRP